MHTVRQQNAVSIGPSTFKNICKWNKTPPYIVILITHFS